eukprot:30011-Chlamydomonas_euryale.AAC.5
MRARCVEARTSNLDIAPQGRGEAMAAACSPAPDHAAPLSNMQSRLKLCSPACHCRNWSLSCPQTPLRANVGGISVRVESLGRHNGSSGVPWYRNN